MGLRSGRIFPPFVNFILYSALLVATPFLLLQRFLPQAVGLASRATFALFGLEIPFVLAIAAVVGIVLLIAARRHITWQRLLGLAAMILLLVLAQNSTDYYFNHEFYELQHNWHYIAYALFAYVVYRGFKPRGMSDERIVLFSFLAALGISTFDEFAQVFISGRIFDISDVAKDAWGVLVGIVGVFFVLGEGNITAHGWRLRHRRVREYFDHPIALLFQQFVLIYIFLLISSILTITRYWAIAVGLSLAAYLCFFLVFHLSQRRIYAIVFLVLALAGLGFQGYRFQQQRHANFTHCEPGFVVYKGIPMPYFDVMIYPDGTFRFVDKKVFFNNKDKINRIYVLATDILIIGTGHRGQGGKGFVERGPAHFVYNPAKEQLLQVIVLPTPVACREFNRLKAAGQSVMCILHNS